MVAARLARVVTTFCYSGGGVATTLIVPRTWVWMGQKQADSPTDSNVSEKRPPLTMPPLSNERSTAVTVCSSAP